MSIAAYLLILAHLAYLAQFFSDLKYDKWINVLIYIWACKYKRACQWAKLVVSLNCFEYLSSSSSLAQFDFSLIFSAINTHYCFWFNLTNRKIFSDWRQMHGKKWSVLTTFFLTATAITIGILNICPLCLFLFLIWISPYFQV